MYPPYRNTLFCKWKQQEVWSIRIAYWWHGFLCSVIMFKLHFQMSCPCNNKAFAAGCRIKCFPFTSAHILSHWWKLLVITWALLRGVVCQQERQATARGSKAVQAPQRLRQQQCKLCNDIRRWELPKGAPSDATISTWAAKGAFQESRILKRQSVASRMPLMSEYRGTW